MLGSDIRSKDTAIITTSTSTSTSTSLHATPQPLATMRLTSGAALAATCCSIATASTVRVYTHDPNWQPAAAGQLSPIEARLVLAQRAGVEDYHEADLSRDGVLDAINAYGVRRSVFPSADSQATRAFIFFDGDYDENCM